MRESIRRIVAAGSLAIAVAAGAPPAAAIDGAAFRAARYLASKQTSSGAFFSSDARADGVAEVVVSLVAGGLDGASVDRALAYLRIHGPSAASKPAWAGRIVMGIVAAGGNPRSFGGVDYVAKIKPDSEGAYDSNLYGHALGALGVLAAGGRVPPAAVQHIREHQCADGGYAYDPGCASAGNLQHALKSNVDTTSLVLCVLVASGISPADEARSKARSFLASAMNAERGYGEYAGAAEPTSANSTGLALSAIAAMGESPSSAPWRSGEADPARTLRAMQESSGAFPPNDYATVQAIPGLAGRAYPVHPSPRFGSVGVDRSSKTDVSPGRASTSPSSSATVSAVAQPVASSEASVSAAAGATPQEPLGNRSRRGILVAVAVAGCAGSAAALRRGRRRWAGSRAR